MSLADDSRGGADGAVEEEDLALKAAIERSLQEK